MKKVVATTNDRDNPRVVLDCEVQVLAALRFEPEKAYFGGVKRDMGAQTKTFTILRADAGPIEPAIISTGSDQITAKLRTLEAGERYALDVTINPPWPNGMLRGNLTLSTGVEKLPKENLMVYANIEKRLKATPQRFLVRPNASADYDLTARLDWSDGKPGNVLKVHVTDAKLSVELRENASRQEIVLHIPAGYTSLKRGGQFVMLTTDDPTVRSIKIPIYMLQTPTKRTQPAAKTGGS